MLGKSHFACTTKLPEIGENLAKVLLRHLVCRIKLASVRNWKSAPCLLVGLPRWVSLVAQLVRISLDAGDPGSIPGLGRSPGEGKVYPLQYSGLENSTDCIAHGATFPGDTVVQRHEFHPWIGRTPGVENGNPLQNSCLENSMGVQGVAKSWTGLSTQGPSPEIGEERPQTGKVGTTSLPGKARCVSLFAAPVKMRAPSQTGPLRAAVTCPYVASGPWKDWCQRQDARGEEFGLW